MAVLILGLLTFRQPSVCGQVVDDQPTAEEKKAALDLADRFETRLDETGDIVPVIQELLVADFTGRWVKEKRAYQANEAVRSDRISYVSGIEYSPALLDQATEDDWRQLYSETFNFMQYTNVAMMNKMAPVILKDKNPVDKDEKDLINDVTNIYPRAVLSLFDKHPILRNFITMKDKTPIKTVADLRSVNTTLKEALDILNKSSANKMKMTPESQKVLKAFREKSGDELGPWIGVADRETYGFPKGTRIMTLFSSPMHELTITKVGGQYKIIDARISSPD